MPDPEMSASVTTQSCCTMFLLVECAVKVMIVLIRLAKEGTTDRQTPFGAEWNFGDA